MPKALHLIDNRADGNTLAVALRRALADATQVVQLARIATAFFNPEGFSRIADELTPVRLLPGAEPPSEASPARRPEASNPLWRRTVTLAGRLACPDGRFSDWAKAVGVEYGPLAEDERETMIHELDALAAHLYGLSEPQLAHCFATFHRGWDYRTRLETVLKHYRQHARTRRTQ